MCLSSVLPLPFPPSFICPLLSFLCLFSSPSCALSSLHPLPWPMHNRVPALRFPSYRSVPLMRPRPRASGSCQWRHAWCWVHDPWEHSCGRRSALLICLLYAFISCAYCACLPYFSTTLNAWRLTCGFLSSSRPCTKLGMVQGRCCIWALKYMYKKVRTSRDLALL